MRLSTDPRVDPEFSDYKPLVRKKLKRLRRLILDTASGIPEIEEVEETLKWGEVSYLVKKGSTLRIDWKAKSPEQYAMYFKCTSNLVPTFKKLYGNTFNYENNRAIVFRLDEDVPVEELKHCIALALTYHRVKHLPLLGA